ncbi:MAG: NAD(P)H-hydrate dehydratase [Chloroflexi bacterium]|nr:NAD(P)H-hydrate dehydratase [Chloroflexota bacterium]
MAASQGDYPGVSSSGLGGGATNEPLTPEVVAALVPDRPAEAHKYRFGRVLALAGSEAFPGAALLCVRAAARCGAGVVTLASHPTVRSVVAVAAPEITHLSLDPEGAPIGPGLWERLDGASAVLVGPGLGRTQPTRDLVRAAVRRCTGRGIPLVVDADGLVALAEDQDLLQALGPTTIVTPHAAEWQRLRGGRGLAADQPLWSQAADDARTWGATLIAKGARSTVAEPGGRTATWPHPNPALATGGTGDVLAGICAGLLAQGLSAWDAARLAVVVQALAAERVLAQRRWRTLLASDLWDEIPAVLHSLAAARTSAS